MKPTPTARTGQYYGSKIYAADGENGTWLEGEEFAYPNGGMTRRCYAKFPDGQLRVVRCGIPDTYFSIPAYARVQGKRIKGYVSSDDGTFVFRPLTQKDLDLPKELDVYRNSRGDNSPE